MRTRLYESSSPRATLALAAVALTAITMGVFVGLPATIDTSGTAAVVAASPPPGTPVDVARDSDVVERAAQARAVSINHAEERS
ncbi:MAG TPA: hypothetical protein VKV24_03145 [Casimicrobiaceae bacterium]|nr:hypothetical protein [Casimicrobiaceae bacterium]